VGAFVFGHPFLTSAHGNPVLPLLGEAPLATAALFDLGVYVTVVGSTMLMLSVLGAASKEPATVPSSAPDLARSPGAAAAPEGAR
jgi:multicomponent K+:H+ antiporter subunit A